MIASNRIVHILSQSWAAAVLTCLVLLVAETPAADPPGAVKDPLRFTVKVEPVLEHDDGQFLWFHPRVATIPQAGRNSPPTALLTLQKHLRASDHYSGLYFMCSDDLGATWTKPELPPELDWRRESDAVDIAVGDVTPGWHAPTSKVIAIGAEVRYSKEGKQLDDKPRSHQTAYAIYDPTTGKWTKWKRLEMPKDDKFNFARSACAQWLVQDDGKLLLPFYFANSPEPCAVTVVQCSFDGQEINYVQHGTELERKVDGGLVEPSLALFQGKYYLTIRNSQRGYVTTSPDGLKYQAIRAWTFDDGKELGSYDTQQHWLVHSDGLFLAYTRRGANNGHIHGHRAPLFIAQVAPDMLNVIRATEQVLIPERGATLGNFGATAVSDRESWVTDAEGVWDEAARKRGAKGTTYVARVQWSRPNRLVTGAKAEPVDP